MIDEVVLQNLYDELFPHVEESHGEKRILVYRSQETDELEELLEPKTGGRRARYQHDNSLEKNEKVWNRSQLWWK